MENELDEYMRMNKEQALKISKNSMKQRALQEEIKSQKRRLRGDMALIQRFKLDLSEAMECAGEPKRLKENVVALYWKYVQTSVKKLDLDTDMQKEYNRQRDYLEKSVDSLKRKLEKDSQAHRIDNMRIMQENVSLIREINDLRREINTLKHERTAQEMQARAQGSSGGGAKEAANEVASQRDQMDALKRTLSELESTGLPANIASMAPATAAAVAQQGSSSRPGTAKTPEQPVDPPPLETPAVQEADPVGDSTPAAAPAAAAAAAAAPADAAPDATINQGDAVQVPQNEGGPGPDQTIPPQAAGETDGGAEATEGGGGTEEAP
jgi:hypothetical protein